MARMMHSCPGMHVTTISGALTGIMARTVRVEVRMRGTGFPGFHIVGLADTAVRESRVRVLAALEHLGSKFGEQQITVNLAPADLPKSGSALDLAIAVALLAAGGIVPQEGLGSTMLLGELGLEGELRPVRGVLPHALAARREGLSTMVLPARCGREATLVEGLEVVAAPDLASLVAHMKGEDPLPPASGSDLVPPTPRRPDMAEVRGQRMAKRVLEVAAAGGHNVLLVGPPGSGKTMLARAFPSILPPLTHGEALETATVHSAAGLLGEGTLPGRPFRAPHHSVSYAGLVGGGRPTRPGEASLAHNGVLFLDEVTEFGGYALDMLREPLEQGRVTVCRVGSTVTFPARFVLLGAMNPCRCGHAGDTRRPCTCTPREKRLYQRRISGPLLDRIDLRVDVPALSWNEIAGSDGAEPSDTVRSRVERARGIQERRNGRTRTGPRLNSRLETRTLERYCRLDEEARRTLQAVVESHGLSARGYTRLLRTARTIADLDGCVGVDRQHLLEAAEHIRPWPGDEQQVISKIDTAEVRNEEVEARQA